MICTRVLARVRRAAPAELGDEHGHGLARRGPEPVAVDLDEGRREQVAEARRGQRRAVRHVEPRDEHGVVGDARGPLVARDEVEAPQDLVRLQGAAGAELRGRDGAVPHREGRVPRRSRARAVAVRVARVPRRRGVARAARAAQEDVDVSRGLQRRDDVRPELGGERLLHGRRLGRAAQHVLQALVPLLAVAPERVAAHDDGEAPRVGRRRGEDDEHGQHTAATADEHGHHAAPRQQHGPQSRGSLSG